MTIHPRKSNKIILLKNNVSNCKNKQAYHIKPIKKTQRGSSKILRLTNNMKQDIIDGNSRFDSRETSTSHKYPTNNQSNMKTFDDANQIDISSLSRGQSPINIEESNKTNIIESERTERKCEKIINNQNINSFPNEMDYEINDMHVGIYPDNISGKNRNDFLDFNNISNENDCNNSLTSDSGNYLNADWRYSRSNWNNYSQIDNQSYSNQYPNNNLSKCIDYHSINKCENCKMLILQNENAQSEIRKLKSDNEKSKEQYKLDIFKLNTEIKNLQSNNENLQCQYNCLDNSKKHFISKYEKKKLQFYKYKSEINKYESKIRHCQSENKELKRKNIESDQLNKNLENKIEKFENQINNLESENKFCHHLKIENENLKTQLINYESEINKFENNETNELNNYLQNEIVKLENQIDYLESKIDNYEPEIEKYKSENKELKRKNIETDQLNKNLENKIEKLENQIINYESEINRYKSEINNYESEINRYTLECEKSKYKNIETDQLNKNLENKIEKLGKQINNLESENKVLNHLKIEYENLKSQITKCVSKIRKCKSLNKRMKGKKVNLERKCKSLNSQFVEFTCENIDLDKYLPTENDNSAIDKCESDIDSEIIQNELDCDNSQTDNITRNLSADNQIENVIQNKDVVSSNRPNEMERELAKPLGFANPKGYCYLNSVVQVLGSCKGFKNDIYNYNWTSTEKTNDSIFVEGLFELIRAIEECNREILDKSLNIVQQNITESSFGDDVYKCFMNLLTRVSNVVKTNVDRPPDHFASLPVTPSEKAINAFTRFKNNNPGFVFDNFYGQLTFQTVCKVCNYVCNESFQMMKSLPLPVPKSNSSVTLNSCIDLFFNESEVEVDDPMKCMCADGSTMSLKSITKLTHGPKYLFIYLNRGSYTDNGDKNNTRITCDDLIIDIKTLEDKSIKYKLISVIDHIGDSAYGHYYCKCSFETEEWWLLNDSQVQRLENKKEVVTNNAIVFLFTITS